MGHISKRSITNDPFYQNLLLTIATLLFAFSLLLSFFSGAQLFSLGTTLLVKIVSLLFFVNSGVVETR